MKPDSTKITVEDVAQLPPPGLAYPTEIAFSPDDRLITYLFSPDFSLTNDLFAYDIATGKQMLLVAPPEGGTTEEGVSLEEALRRERMRQTATGITHYAWPEKGGRILIASHGDIFVADGPGQPLRLVVSGHPHPALDPQFSPDGHWIGYVQDAELYVVSAEPGPVEPQQITREARGTGRTNGLAEFIAMEEMARRHGFWWSVDGQRLAFEEVDEMHIPIYRIVHQGKDQSGPSAQEDHHYPFAGEENARLRLGVVTREGGDPVWMDLGDQAEERYLARVDWLPDGRLAAQLENREQTYLELACFDLHTGERQAILTETNEVWINLNDLFWSLEDGRFIWGSERSGFRHLYLYDRDGHLIRPLTQGEWIVDTVAGVDEQKGILYLTGNRENPTEAQLYAVPLEGGQPRRITPEAGTHAVVLDHDCGRFVDTYQSIGQPPVVRLRSLEDARVLATIYTPSDPRLERLKLRPPEIVSLKNRHGTTLYGAIFRPPERYGSRPYPLIVNVYGGPHVQLVADSWRLTATMRAQELAELGYLVFTLDNRGSARRGLAFEGALKNHFGTVEVEDQVDGVRWLVEEVLADPQRVGIYGWSGGGYMSLMCLMRAPEVFKVAVAGAPVTHHGGYDTHYTERYMGTPQANPQGYAGSSVMAHVDAMQGRLLLVHGLIDENVHFRHTARLIDAMLHAGKPYELLLIPNGRHSIRRQQDRIYMERRIRDYFLAHLPVEETTDKRR